MSLRTYMIVIPFLVNDLWSSLKKGGQDCFKNFSTHQRALFFSFCFWLPKVNH